MKIRSKFARLVNRIFRSEKERLEDLSLVQMMNKGLRFVRNEVEIIFEIGANHGQDGKTLQKYYGVSEENIYLFEPHPELAKEIRKKFPRFNLFEYALSDEKKKATFNIAPVGIENDGISTLGKKTLVTGAEEYVPVEVDVETLDNIMKLPELHNIDKIDIMKIDVEGFSFEVLKGGINTLKNKVVMVQVESEVEEIYKGQKLYPEIASFLTDLGFVEVYKEQYVTQNDTVWVKKEYLMKPEDFYRKADS